MENEQGVWVPLSRQIKEGPLNRWQLNQNTID